MKIGTILALAGSTIVIGGVVVAVVKKNEPNGATASGEIALPTDVRIYKEGGAFHYAIRSSYMENGQVGLYGMSLTSNDETYPTPQAAWDAAKRELGARLLE